ncbi:MAG TPA: phosphocholine cytidylyltransferase family protein [Candidatus Nanoarchaeia archaeon]|nr:phosphocholine cytidylyltransferase family protein [Candidatus Nanoarchaeia archaeon]
MKAIILAAGKSSRLYPLTLDKPKCLLELEDGKTIIEHQIDTIRKCGVSDILVVVGYLKEKIKEVLGDQVRYKEFNDFKKYNNLHTMYSIKDELDDDFLCLFSDVVFGKDLLKKCVDSKEDFCLLIHNKNILGDTMRVKIINGSIVDIGGHIPVEEGDGNFIGVAKFSKNGARLLVNQMGKMVNKEKHNNDYYTIPLINIAKSNKISYVIVGDEPWGEIDFLKDYKRIKKKIYPLIK